MKTVGIVCLCIVGVLLLAAGVLWLLAPKMVFRFIFSKPKRSTKIPKFYVGSPHYKVSRAGMALMKNAECHDVYIHSFDHLKLHAYLFPCGGERKKFVIGVHGFRSYARPEFAPYYSFYQSLGFNMLLPDDRAHAPSEGNYIGFSVIDRLDCVEFAKYLVKTYGEDIQILLHGVSMGGATVVAASGEESLPKQVIGVVADCAFTRGYEILEYQLHTAAHLPAKQILPSVEKLLIKKAGYDLHSHSAIEQVENSKVPMLFVQGEKDQMVPPYMAKELYDRCKTKKKLLMVPEAGHGESIAFAKEEYEESIRTLFGV